tara:strand:+ start:80 stop:265 length:186 start_codon:yes stop_codon:yes gene_type:complete
MDRATKAKKQHRSGGKFAKRPSLKEQGYDIADGGLKVCASCGNQQRPIMNTWKCRECGHQH